MEIGYNFLIPSATESDSYYVPASTEVTNPFSFQYEIGNPWSSNSYSRFQHHQLGIAIAAEGNFVKWCLATAYDMLDYTYLDKHFQANHLRLALAAQFYILKRKHFHILVGPDLHVGWIMRYTYSSPAATQTNPDIGQKTGCDLMFPLSLVFPITERSRLFLQVSGGLHLRNDHELPYMNHWGTGPGPEAGLLSYCPLSIGMGYSLLLNK